MKSTSCGKNNGKSFTGNRRVTKWISKSTKNKKAY